MLRPDDRLLLTQLALVLEQLDAYAELLQLLAEAAVRWPRDNDLLLHRLRILSYLGRFSEAAAGYRELLEREPGHIGALFSMVMQDHGEEIGGLACIQARLADDGLSAPQRRLLCYAQAHLLERDQRFEEAFAVFRQANAIGAAGGGMNIPAKQRGARAVLADIDAEVIDQCSGRGHQSERPVFIIGMPRSGTSLTEQILASHPDVYAAGERLFWGEILGRLVKSAPQSADSMVAAIDSMHSGVWENAGADYLRHVSEINSDSLRITDKLPANFGLLPFIRLIFPRARILHVRRDPLATIASCIRTPFSDPSLACTVEDWARYYGIYQALIARWRPLLGDQMLELDYEELVSDLPGQARRLTAFLGLRWDDACQHPELNQRAVRTASAGQVRRKVHLESVDAWRCYQAQLAAITPHIEESRRLLLTATPS